MKSTKTGAPQNIISKPCWQVMNMVSITFKYSHRCTAGYRFTKELTQNLNLRTNLKLEYNVKSLNYIQQSFRFQASFLFCWTMSFYFFT